MDQRFDRFDHPTYMRTDGNEGPSSASSFVSHFSSQISVNNVNLDPDHDQWLQYNGYQPTFDYLQQPYNQVDPMAHFTTYLQPSGGVLGSPISLASPSDPSFGSQHPDPFIFTRNSSAVPRGHSGIPEIRVITDVPSSVPHFSTQGIAFSPHSESSSGSSLASHPSTPMFPQGPYFNPSPVSDIASPYIVSPNTPDYSSNTHQYAHQSTQTIWEIVASFPPTGRGPPIPQKPYRPHTLSDRKRYVEEVDLEEPITFIMKDPDECGIPLSDALTGKYMRLKGRDDAMFVQRGPSVSIRLKWPGYGNWSRQIPTKDFRSPPGPITRAKLAKNIARTVERFIKEKQSKQHFDPDDEHWRVGPGHIGVNDLVLVGLQHVSKGSWQAHLRLARPKNVFPSS